MDIPSAEQERQPFWRMAPREWVLRGGKEFQVVHLLPFAGARLPSERRPHGHPQRADRVGGLVLSYGTGGAFCQRDVLRLLFRAGRPQVANPFLRGGSGALPGSGVFPEDGEESTAAFSADKTQIFRRNPENIRKFPEYSISRLVPVITVQTGVIVKRNHRAGNVIFQYCFRKLYEFVFKCGGIRKPGQSICLGQLEQPLFFLFLTVPGNQIESQKRKASEKPGKEKDGIFRG